MRGWSRFVLAFVLVVALADSSGGVTSLTRGPAAARAGGSPDTDGDAIPDSIEKAAAYESRGGSYTHKDVWVEIDYMRGLKPNPVMRFYLRRAFRDAPVANPDGRSGIKLHITADDQLPFEEKWGDVLTSEGWLMTWVKLRDARSDHLDGDRRYYHYGVFVNKIDDSYGTTGWSMDSTNSSVEIPGDMFVVALGSLWPELGPTVGAQTGTVMHELGHNLGLKHGGINHQNYKPNYLSVMNYDFQFGFRDLEGNRLPKWDYSRWRPNFLDERRLLERKGVTAPAWAEAYAGVRRCEDAEMMTPSSSRSTSRWTGIVTGKSNCPRWATSTATGASRGSSDRTIGHTCGSTAARWTAPRRPARAIGCPES